jgi:hypothetical protein
MGVSERTIMTYKNKRKVHKAQDNPQDIFIKIESPEELKKIERFKKNYANVLNNRIQVILESFPDEVIKLLEPRDRITLYKAFDERKRLEEGSATKIVQYDNLQKELKALEKEEKEIKTRMAQWEAKKKKKVC